MSNTNFTCTNCQDVRQTMHYRKLCTDCNALLNKAEDNLELLEDCLLMLEELQHCLPEEHGGMMCPVCNDEKGSHCTKCKLHVLIKKLNTVI